MVANTAEEKKKNEEKQFLVTVKQGLILVFGNN